MAAQGRRLIRVLKRIDNTLFNFAPQPGGIRYLTDDAGNALALLVTYLDPTFDEPLAPGFAWDGATNRNLNIRVRSGTRELTLGQATDDASSAANDAGFVVGFNHLYSGVGQTWNRWRNNVEATVLASASRAVGTTNSADITLFNAQRVNLIIDVTAVGAAGTVQLIVDVKDPVSGNYSAVATFVADTANGTYSKQAGPGLTAAGGANGFEILNRGLARVIRVRVVVAANAVTESLGIVHLV